MELSFLVLYAQAITHPYMCQVHGHGSADTNLCDLGPVHDKVIAHCHAIIANPDLLLSPKALYESGSMDDKIWEWLDAFYAVHKLAPRLLNLRGALIAFFEGALETWLCFTVKFQPSGEIASASSAERHHAFMRTTNDDNEGALGEKRQSTCCALNMTLEQHNTCTMYQRNITAAFIKKCLSPEDHKYL